MMTIVKCSLRYFSTFRFWNAASVVSTLLALMLSFFITSTYAQPLDQAYWSDAGEPSLTQTQRRVIIPQQYRTLRLDLEALRSYLAQIPHEENVLVVESGFVVTLPLPEGGFGRFQAVQSPIMAPELEAKFPEIRTYLGQGIDDQSASARFDVTPAGFHAIIFSTRGTIYIDPYAMGMTDHYIVYFKRDLAWDPSRAFVEEGPEVYEQEIVEEIRSIISQGLVVESGSQLRTYRAAVAATGEYTTFHGGTVSAGMAAITTAMNRVNGIYEREVAVRMVLVANNNLIVYTNGATDPYTNGNGSTMLGENQSNLDAVIGNANYDIGHVFSTGGGGIAGLGVVCRTSFKARGVTGLPSPIGDPFYVDYVAHEMGHQFGANHTFNGNAGSCSGNRNSSTAYEPGSGSTIMAYAGICGSQDLQPNSDDYFHGASFDEIVAYTTTGSGSSCPTVTSTGNSPPTVNTGIGGLTLPISTPFALTGSATDPNGDTLRYCWEEFDLGPAGAPNSPSGNAPIFRSFLPILSPQRIFPKLSDILNNTQTIGEILPTYTRTLVFRLTARDYRAGGGGVGKATASFSVTGSAGPFTVTSPNTAVTWTGYETQTVTWNVASTNVSPVNCTLVNILLSTSGGQSWGFVLTSGTPNDGSQTITVPNVATSSARVKVEAADHLFFDVSNTNFTIVLSPASVTVTVPNGGELWPIGSTQTIQWTSAGFSGDVKIELSRDGGGSYATLFASTANDGSESWLVTEPITSNAVMRISSVSMPAVFDVSNSSFTININFTLLARMVLRDNGGDADSLEFGTAEGATDGIDTQFGEYELPPIPPFGVFDVRWQVSGIQGMKRDIRDTLGGSRELATYTGKLQAGEGGFPFHLRWNPLELPDSGSFILRYLAETLISINMKQQDSAVITDAETFQVIYSLGTTVSSTVQQGWNIVSVPVTVADLRKIEVFPTSTSNAFAYGPSGYVARDTLDYGVGYWLKFDLAQAVSVTGGTRSQDTIDVVTGWNIIGSISDPVTVGSIVQIPSGIVVSSYFGYGSTGYTPATTIEPMKGYWVKVNQSGQLVLIGSVSAHPARMSTGVR
jgi:hypothetical protein